MSSAGVQKDSQSETIAAAQAVQTSPETPLETKTAVPEPEKRTRSAAPKVGLFALLLIFGGLGWHVASDQMAPTGSTGAVAAFTAQIAPRASGQVAQVFVSDNQFVEAGDPLFALDPAPFDLAIRQAEVALHQAQVSSDAAQLSLAGAEAQVDQARAAVESTHTSTERTASLFDRGLVSQAQMDTANAQLASARSTLEAAEAELASARMQAGNGDAEGPQVEAARVQLEQARLNREFSVAVAPNAGVITNLRLTVGQFVNVGSPALTFIEGHQPWLVVDMRENQLANMTVGNPASVVFDAVPGQTFDGRVRGIAWGIDTGRTAANGLPQNQASTRWFEPARTIPVHIELADGEPWPANVRVGSKANAAVYTLGRDNPVAWITSVLQTIGAYVSYLY